VDSYGDCGPALVLWQLEPSLVKSGTFSMLHISVWDIESSNSVLLVLSSTSFAPGEKSLRSPKSFMPASRGSLEMVDSRSPSLPD